MAISDGPKLTHRTQIMLTDEQHRWLTIRAKQMDSSLAAVIRQLLDDEMAPATDLMNDPFIQYLLSPPEPEDPDAMSKVKALDREIYGDPEFNR